MTTAFVLGGGGVLGAVEVGMLRALLERDITPDLVLGTSVGALNGALVARDPDLSVIDRLTELWLDVAARSRQVYGDRPLRTVRRAVSSGTHIYSSKPLQQRLREEFGDALIEDLPVRFQVCAASIERAAEHWFDSGPLVDAVVASAAVPGLLPPARVGGEHYLDGGIVNSIPLARAVQLGADPAVRAAGGPDRPAADACRAGRGRWPGCPSRSPVATGSPARWPSCPTTSRRTSSPPAARPHATTRSAATATSPPSSSASTRRTTPPGTTWTGCEPAAGRGCCAALVLAPAVVGLTALMWVTLPAWLIVAAVLSPLLPGRWRALRLLWVVMLYLTCEALLLLVLLGLWFSSGFGRRVRTPYFEGIHYDLVQGVMWVFFREARRVLRLQIATDGPSPDAHPGVPLLVALPPRRSGRLVHADPRADALVRPRAARRPQGHARLGPGDRRGAQPAPGPVHRPPRRRPRDATSRSSPTASTRTTRS